MLEGRIDAETQLGRIRDGKHQHQHGWDLTFSAPKSVSLVALVGGDERLVAAHDAAVREALGWLQDNALSTRSRHGGEALEEPARHMVAAVFRHDLSRAAEPQLHSHAVVMNATIGSKAAWQSVHSIRLYVNAKEAGERYQQALAARAAELGYAIVPSRNSTFELDGIPRDVSLLFSSRAKAVEDRLAEQGLTRAGATGLQREEAALRTRGAKPEVDRICNAARTRHWPASTGSISSASWLKPKSVAGHWSMSPSGIGSIRMLVLRHPSRHCARCARRQRSSPSMTPRSPPGASSSARQMSLGTARAEQIDQAGAQLQSRGELVERQVRAIDPVTRHPTLLPGFTTAAMIQTERRMLALEQAGRGAVDRFMHRLDAQALVGSAWALAEDRGFSWTHGQAEATKGVLTRANTERLVQRGNKVSRKRLSLWFKKRGRALDLPSKRQARRFSGAIHTPVSCEG